MQPRNHETTKPRNTRHEEPLVQESLLRAFVLSCFRAFVLSWFRGFVVSWSRFSLGAYGFNNGSKAWRGRMRRRMVRHAAHRGVSTESAHRRPVDRRA